MKYHRNSASWSDLLAGAMARALRIWKRPGFWAVVLCIALFCAYSGPFGTYQSFGFSIRLLYWLSVVIVTAMMGIWVSELAIEADLRFFPETISLGGLFGLGVTAVVVTLQWVFEMRLLPADFIWSLFLLSFPTAVVIFLVANRLMRAKETALADTGERTVPKLFQRLERIANATELVSLSAQDHYVEISTDKGSELCLIRLSDAIAECSPVEGFQIHRSHWVALAAVDRLNIRGDKPHVLLKSGQALPISRARTKPFEAALRTHAAMT